MRGKIIKLYEEDEDILEDAITENRQAIEMANKRDRNFGLFFYN